MTLNLRLAVASKRRKCAILDFFDDPAQMSAVGDKSVKIGEPTDSQKAATADSELFFASLCKASNHHLCEFDIILRANSDTWDSDHS